ncbi:uncharacterized protein PAC_05990 [Phialocephala subalpina]|uniref:Mid2 domain-containing protein n=1 Tax=Phialocephala subalpina TaxID=576137 RepID=A0A1L7WTK3_9HELO|nr:uncharacterized protein PAC_05990 [Phialocephala subalpina]
MTVLTTSLLSMLLLLPPSLAQRLCYFSDGTAADGYSACNNNTEHSGCCRLYQTNGTPVDLCTTNGLCLGRNGVWNGFFFQSGCTDPTWQSSNCPHACPALDSPESNVVQPCNASSGGLWCCRADGTDDCCGSAKALAIGQLILPTSLSSSTSSSSSSSPISTSTTQAIPPNSNSTLSPSTSCAPSSTASGPKPQVSTATIGIGASLGVAFLVTLGMLGWREWAWRKRPVVTFVQGTQEGGSDKVSEVSALPKVYHELGRYGHECQELGGSGHGRPELDGFNHF